jgi:DNA-directed RNA polymerase subunit K/omega
MQKSVSKYASDESEPEPEPESPSASEGEGEDVNSDDEQSASKTNKETISKVKSILGFGDEDSDNGTPKVSDSETETDMEGDDTEGEGLDEEGEPEEVPSIKNGFSKLLGSLKNAVGNIGSDSGSAAVEAEAANIDKPGRRKGKSGAAAAAAASSKPASASASRNKKVRGIQPTEAELGYNSDEDDEGENSDDENMDDDDDDESKLKKFDKDLREDYLVNFHPESLIQNYDEIYNLARVVRDANGVIVDSLHRTLPMMTKYEKTRILGQRAKQINDGATPFVKVPENVIDGYLIAIKELEEKKIPFIIRRPLPNLGSEYWMVEDLEIVI